jgi:hypothetical protein
MTEPSLEGTLKASLRSRDARRCLKYGRRRFQRPLPPILSRCDPLTNRHTRAGMRFVR